MEKRVLITGGNKGIGLETTELFVKDGYEVIVVARNFEDFKFNQNPKVHIVQYDLTNTKGIHLLIDNIISNFGSIDILINNAGIMNSIAYDNYPVQDIERLMKINLYAPIEFITHVSDKMIKNGGGRIVNMASIAGEIGHPDIWYGISKAGIINATKSFAKLLGGKGLVVNSVAPGPVNTEMLKIIPEARKAEIKDAVFTRRFAKAGEVAKTMYWLATEAPEYINGVCIDINNGAFLR